MAREEALYVTKISASHPKSFSTKCRKDQREQGQGVESREGGGACVARVPESALYKVNVNMINLYGIVLLLLLLWLLPSLFSPSPPMETTTTTKCANESVERSWSEMRQLF